MEFLGIPRGEILEFIDRKSQNGRSVSVGYFAKEFYLSPETTFEILKTLWMDGFTFEVSSSNKRVITELDGHEGLAQHKGLKFRTTVLSHFIAASFRGKLKCLT